MVALKNWACSLMPIEHVTADLVLLCFHIVFVWLLVAVSLDYHSWCEPPFWHESELQVRQTRDLSYLIIHLSLLSIYLSINCRRGTGRAILYHMLQTASCGTHLASRASAKTPAASGAAAEVPE